MTEELIRQEESLEVLDFSEGALSIPKRNWALLIESYNSDRKQKFPYSPLDCARLIEYAKKSVPVKSVFKYLRTSAQKYTNLVNNYIAMEERLIELTNKNDHTPEEYLEFQSLKKNPYRILMSDLDQAIGAGEISDWERFNEMAYQDPNTMTTKMKAKFRDFFDDKESGVQSGQVVINIGGNFIDEL